MGLLTDYFAATPEQAAAVDIQTGPTGPADESARQDRPSVDGSTRAPRRVEDVLAVKGFEPTVTMATLEGILTGAEFMEIIESDAEPVIADGGPDGPWLVMIRAQLQAALVSTPPGGWRAVAERWAATEKMVGTPASVAVAFLEELAGLARRASDRDQRLYCWMSL
jgi:hypothetical protein